MKLNDLKVFIEECEIKNVKLPLMTIECEDFYDHVPEEMHHIRPIEFNYSESRINIIPKEIKI